MNRIPFKYKQMVWMGTFMTGVIAYSKVSSDPSSTWFDKITMPILIASCGAFIAAAIALLVWVVEHLKAYRAASRQYIHQRQQGPKN